MNDEAPEELREQLGYLLGRAHLVHREIAQRLLRDLDLAPRELGALLLLVAEGPLSQRRLGELQGIDRTTMVAVVDGLERKELVERRRSAEDRRSYSLVATARGRRLVPRARAATRRAEDRFLEPLTDAERRTLKALLDRAIGASDPEDG